MINYKKIVAILNQASYVHLKIKRDIFKKAEIYVIIQDISKFEIE